MALCYEEHDHTMRFVYALNIPSMDMAEDDGIFVMHNNGNERFVIVSSF